MINKILDFDSDLLGISQSDLYQMQSYANSYMLDYDEVSIHLIYPAVETTNLSKIEDWHFASNKNIKVCIQFFPI